MNFSHANLCLRTQICRLRKGMVIKMNQYVTGAVIKGLREKNKITQLQLAERIGVSDKTISK